MKVFGSKKNMENQSHRFLASGREKIHCRLEQAGGWVPCKLGELGGSSHVAAHRKDGQRSFDLPLAKMAPVHVLQGTEKLHV